MCHGVAMWIVVLLALGVVVALWQVIVAGLVLWALVCAVRWWIALALAARTKPARPRRPVQTRPAARTVQTRPAPKPQPRPVGGLPAPGYLPRWTASRRLDARREHAQWQIEFENTAR